ncbi:tetratricopeptide repeat protein [Variovorax sp. J22P168]|uniref:tetratricopeptide repeat protein n=1 Tax=Variovorax jilinensis TaxID=3053513 RepID=UPI0025769356|nr:tetratricopeptide repeat protein [Variovorax sp. J22P168]MDM0013641.1 tetratricopeptide repeat protein [Variovorax sp. J22P168]
MSGPEAEAPHTLRALQEMLGLSRSAVSRLIAHGFVTPARGPRNEYRFSFRDVVLLRTAHRLQQAAIPTRRIVRALQRLRASLPAELPLSGLRITAVGSSIAVHERGSRWEAESGQLLMDFEVEALPGSVAFVDHGRSAASSASLPLPPEPAPSSDTVFAQAEALETADPATAERLYRALLADSPGHADACLNLGALLSESNRGAEAVALYDLGLRHSPLATLLHFNRAVTLDDLGRLEEALQGYESCLAIDPDFADAHFNAARLYDHLGDQKQAIRHFSAYRRLQKKR